MRQLVIIILVLGLLIGGVACSKKEAAIAMETLMQTYPTTPDADPNRLAVYRAPASADKMAPLARPLDTTAAPTAPPTAAPTAATITAAPTVAATIAPTAAPTAAPTVAPTAAATTTAVATTTASEPTKVANLKGVRSFSSGVTISGDLETWLNSQTLPVFIEYSSDNCPPCERLKPSLEQVAFLLTGKAIIIEVNVSEQQNFGLKNSVTGTPTMHAWKSGDKKLGYMEQDVLKSWIDSILAR